MKINENNLLTTILSVAILGLTTGRMEMLEYKCDGGVVAWNIDGTISNDKRKLEAALTLNRPVVLVTDREAHFMAACDLGCNWERLAKLPVLFQTTDLK